MNKETDFMTGAMAEVAWLTRTGRLAEATALIKRNLGLGTNRQPNFNTTIVEAPPIDISSTVSSEPAAPPDSPPAAEADTRTRPARPETDPGTSFNRVSGTPAAPVDFTDSAPLPTYGVFGKLPGRASERKRFSAEVVAPASGRWTVPNYAGEAGRRGCKLYLPGRYQGQPLPLVVMLHGCTQNADDFAAGTRMNFLAEQEGVLVLYPEQVQKANMSRCWNWFQPADQQRGQGEPAIIAAITSAVIAGHNVDARRVYIAGLSAGGAMAAILAANYPDLFAAVGVHSGLAPGCARDLPSAMQAMQGRGLRSSSAGPGRTVPLILFQGDNDSTVHPRNAEELVRQWAGAIEKNPASLRQGQVQGGRAYSCATYRQPGGQTFLEHWTIHGASHAWSGGSPNGSFTDPAGPDASRELLRFFLEHPRANQPLT